MYARFSRINCDEGEKCLHAKAALFILVVSVSYADSAQLMLFNKRPSNLTRGVSQQLLRSVPGIYFRLQNFCYRLLAAVR